MEWIKGVVGGEEEKIEVPDVPAPEAPTDFQISEEPENINVKMAKAIKYEDIAAEAKDLTLDAHEFNEDLTIAMQKPLVEPQGTPPPPHGPGPHKNYQATLVEKIHLTNPQKTNAQIGIQLGFSPDWSDVAMCTYSNKMGHSGVLARSIGPFSCMAQWMQSPMGPGMALYANADYKAESSIDSLTFVRNQRWSLSHMHTLWNGFSVGAKATHDLTSSRSHLGFGFKWAAPAKTHIWSGEVDEEGAKLSCVKRLEGAADTSVACVYQYTKGQGPQNPPGSSLWIGFGREYLMGLKVKVAMSSMLTTKAVMEAPIGRAMKATYSMMYHPQKRAFKHGVQLEM
eukprot:TRINITY_DN7356_c0_g1_i1.p1 TRINITY_DN7356_c0_g1~~TRINITY_DN7356_c0_g1_i1.p1  ORF type:complete len:340 (+),score=145.11 TRINITY_DN7356_c0_g1_i1:56-1075(+)